MKVFKLAAAATIVAMCAVACLSFVAPDSFAAAVNDPTAMLAAGELLIANPVLIALRSKHGDLTRQAAAKIAEVRDGMAAADVQVIETAHADLVRQVADVQTQITAEEQRAANPNNPPAPAPTDAATRAAAEAAATAAVAAERQRVADITAACETFGMRDLAADMIGRGITIDAARGEIQTKLAAQSGQNRQRPQVQVTQDEGDTIRRAVESAIILRANPSAIAANAPEREMARNWRGMSLMETGRVFLEETQGIRLRGMGRMEMATALLGLDTLGSRSAGMHSTSDFASLLANVASKRLRDAYQAAPQTFKPFCRQSNNPDFKTKSVVQLSSSPAFKLVREGAEYTYGGLTDGVEQYALATYGRIIAITRQTLINDDLGAFDRLPRMLGQAAADLESTTVYSILLSNPAMSDTVALFHGDHGNLPAAAAIDETNLALAEKAMRDQRGFAAKAADREYLNLTPRYLIVGNAKKVQAQKMLTAVTPSAASEVNVFQNSMQLIVEARITGNKWFLSADPAQIDTIEYSYLEGEEGVFTEERIGFEVDGIQIKGRLDFAAKAIDHRGMVYNSGA